MKNKTKKLRGHKTDGHGGMKRGRGKGERGGTGSAGAGKHKRTSLKKNWGSYGFHRYTQKQDKKIINVAALNDYEGEINLKEMGYYKLLGAGTITKPLKVIIPKASSKAINKITEAGGEERVD